MRWTCPRHWATRLDSRYFDRLLQSCRIIWALAIATVIVVTGSRTARPEAGVGFAAGFDRLAACLARWAVRDVE